MALIDVTPIMTSNNTPAPCVITSSSEYSSSYQWFQAFDDNNNTLGASSRFDNNKWVMIDLGKEYKVNIVTIVAHGNSDFAETSLGRAIFLGSKDGVNFDEILSIENQVWNTAKEKKIFRFKPSTYRYYKFANIVAASASSHVAIGDIKLQYDDSLDSEGVSYTRAFHAQTLPMNTTTNILAKSNDARTGLMGIANDGDNFGTAYVVDPTGKSKMMMAGMRSEVLFEGSANAIGEYDLLKDIGQYKCINVISSVTTTTGETNMLCNMIPVVTINHSYQNQFMYNASFGSIERRMTYMFPSKTKFKIDLLNKDANIQAIKISKIIGVY